MLGAAGAALIGWLGYAFGISIGRSSGADRALVVALLAVAIAVAAVVITSAPVRDAEVAMARPLLGVDLPPVRDRRSWASRGRGAAWALWVLVVGATAAIVLLAGVPAGVALAVSGIGSGAQVLWRMPLGVLIALGSFAAQSGFGWLLVWAAPRVLGPTTSDRLAFAADRERELARRNELARELHDSIGHSLTAISVQAEAGRAVGGTDPQLASLAFDRIIAGANSALEELDSVLGGLRGDRPGKSLADVSALVGAAATRAPSDLEVTGEWRRLGPTTSGQLYRIVQEGLTNAAKHGTGGAHVCIDIDSQVVVRMTNFVAGQQDRAGRSGHGLIGLAERAAVTGGSLEVGPVSGGQEWQLCARLPIR